LRTQETFFLVKRQKMKKLSVDSIIAALEQGMPLKPSVGPMDRITDAIEVMLKNDLKRIAVIDGHEPVGMIRLEDALREVGLGGKLKTRGTRIVVFQGRKFEVEQ
jgi:CBS domain-containing protein